MVNLLAAFRHSLQNRAELESSSVCGCFHCMQMFSPEEIIAWSGWNPETLDDPQSEGTETALCPRCGSESVVGDKSGYAVNPQFLVRMHEAWFQKTIIRKPPNKK
jgi:hypothetical protein